MHFAPGSRQRMLAEVLLSSQIPLANLMIFPIQDFQIASISALSSLSTASADLQPAHPRSGPFTRTITKRPNPHSDYLLHTIDGKSPT
ncbi:hypothetical protein PGTUg99_022071 [Puccinia graminis f. sp. tritici]|uniref:Uncharacterized protein n=1 Tax=Puccinia graminis f. sp. tritici TaxID=56615 RepID=A0A5B0RSU4_PUCGR|nr:hypothetical protein PGTUg99_022071 [Puccinia graminis f. sp. tritici]